jgi:indole-3-glycerol phosphate synthase / phosphoribosylanthranilate isomerase
MAEGILGKIAAAKRAEVAARFDGVTLDAIRARAPKTTRSLAEAIAQPGSRFILEIKKGSPSQGAIREGADPTMIARGYAGVADALSVLTDREFFGGSTDDLAAARASFDAPILAKDFFIDPRQVAEARIAGADAILVMLSLAARRQARCGTDRRSASVRHGSLG